MRSLPAFDLRRPEYTGSNRCWPCTVVNGAIVAVGSVLLAAVSSRVVGVAGAVAGFAVVWLRGYLLPGTPRFAPRIVAAIPGGERLFDTASDGEIDSPDAGGSLSAGRGPDDPEELLGRLIECGVLEVDGDTVAPTTAYDERWHAEMDQLRGNSTAELAAAAETISPAAEARAVSEDDEWVALTPTDGNVIDETWLTRPVAIAEIAAYRAAEGVLSEEATRLAAARTNRMFLETCPDCGAELEQGVDMPCCGGHTGPGEEPAETLVCPDCEVRLYTFA